MNKSVIKKICSKCKDSKSLSEFYKRKKSGDGLQPECKICRLKQMKEYYQTEKGKKVQGKSVHRKSSKKYQKTKNRRIVSRYCKTKKGKVNFKRYRIRHPNRCKARSAVMIAIKKNNLPRPDNFQCYYCPRQAKQYHHWHGYEPKHWLDVIPVCIDCHKKHKRKIA